MGDGGREDPGCGVGSPPCGLPVHGAIKIGQSGPTAWEQTRLGGGGIVILMCDDHFNTPFSDWPVPRQAVEKDYRTGEIPEPG